MGWVTSDKKYETKKIILYWFLLIWKAERNRDLPSTVHSANVLNREARSPEISLGPQESSPHALPPRAVPWGCICWCSGSTNKCGCPGALPTCTAGCFSTMLLAARTRSFNCNTSEAQGSTLQPFCLKREKIITVCGSTPCCQKYFEGLPILLNFPEEFI